MNVFPASADAKRTITLRWVMGIAAAALLFDGGSRESVEQGAGHWGS
jgi:hypothetical protein